MFQKSNFPVTSEWQLKFIGDLLYCQPWALYLPRASGDIHTTTVKSIVDRNLCWFLRVQDIPEEIVVYIFWTIKDEYVARLNGHITWTKLNTDSNRSHLSWRWHQQNLETYVVINQTTRRTVFLWDFSQRRMLLSYRSFGKTCRSHIQGLSRNVY